MPDTYVVPSRFHIDKRAADLAEEIAADDVELDELLDTKELAMLTKMSVEFYEIGRCHGYGPKFIRLSPRRVKYRRSDVIAWLNERSYASTAEYGLKPDARRAARKLREGRTPRWGFRRGASTPRSRR